MRLLANIIPYWHLMRLDRPIGILLLLWPTLWALWLAADGMPSLKVLVIFLFGTVLMRSAGCIINDYADRNFDGHVERTQWRPLVTGAANKKTALILFTLLCLFAFGLVLLLNKLAIALAFVGVVLACVYPLSKRFLQLPQLVLGLAFAWGIPMGFAAVQHQVPAIAWLLFAATFFWVVAYDTQYALSDREDDLKIGVKSSAIFFGRFDRHWIALFQLAFLLSLVLVAKSLQLAWWFYLGLIVVVVLFSYQHRLTYKRGRAACLKAFLNNNWVGLVIFCGVVHG